MCIRDRRYTQDRFIYRVYREYTIYRGAMEGDVFLYIHISTRPAGAAAPPPPCLLLPCSRQANCNYGKFHAATRSSAGPADIRPAHPRREVTSWAAEMELLLFYCHLALAVGGGVSLRRQEVNSTCDVGISSKKRTHQGKQKDGEKARPGYHITNVYGLSG